jgi:hypothetical protein
VFLSQSVTERRRGVGPAAVAHVDFQQQLRVGVDCSGQPLLLAIDLDLFLVNRDPRR